MSLLRENYIWRSKTSEFFGALKLASQLRALGGEVYFAGGAVRDDLLGLIPKDYDLACSLAPDEALIGELSANYKVISIGAQFGILKLVCRESGHEYDLARFRKDSLEGDGRRPTSVEFSEPEEDAKRRDFTVNALFYDPISEEIIDYVGGLNDLRLKRLVVVGEPRLRFKEDYLRILRFFRFISVLSFSFKSEDFLAISACKNGLKQLAKERCLHELSLLLEGKNFMNAVQLMQQSEILQELWPQAQNADVLLLRSIDSVSEPTLKLAVFWQTILGNTQDWPLSAKIKKLIDCVSKGPGSDFFTKLTFDEQLEWCFTPDALLLMPWFKMTQMSALKEVLPILQLHHFSRPQPTLKASDFPEQSGQELGESLKLAWLLQLKNPQLDRQSLLNKLADS